MADGEMVHLDKPRPRNHSLFGRDFLQSMDGTLNLIKKI